MPSVAVGLNCAVVRRFDLLVSTRTRAARETQAVFYQRVVRARPKLGALNLGSGEDWQRESEGGAARPVGVRPQSSAVGIDNGAAYCEADSRAAGLGGVEGFENSLTMLRRDAGA